MSKFQKGQTGNPFGRPKGRLSKETSRFKEALNNLLEQSSDKMIQWLDQIDTPQARFNVLKDFAEYIHPKLARTEMQHLDEEGKPARPSFQVTVEGIKP